MTPVEISTKLTPDNVQTVMDTLKHYADTFCEGFCDDLPERGTYHVDMELLCSGCKARAVLAALNGEPK